MENSLQVFYITKGAVTFTVVREFSRQNLVFSKGIHASVISHTRAKGFPNSSNANIVFICQSFLRDLKGTKTAQKSRHCESTSQRSLLYNPSRGPSAIFVPGYASRLGIFSGD